MQTVAIDHRIIGNVSCGPKPRRLAARRARLRSASFPVLLACTRGIKSRRPEQIGVEPTLFPLKIRRRQSRLRAARADPAIFPIVVDAKDDTAARFYEHLGFRRFTNRAGSLFVPVATAWEAFDLTK
jgi:hypothetical protein